jgi:hypothetical protein
LTKGKDLWKEGYKVLKVDSMAVLGRSGKPLLFSLFLVLSIVSCTKNPIGIRESPILAQNSRSTREAYDEFAAFSESGDQVQSPDGKLIAYFDEEDLLLENFAVRHILFVGPAGGGSAAIAKTHVRGGPNCLSWSPNSRWIIFSGGIESRSDDGFEFPVGLWLMDTTTNEYILVADGYFRCTKWNSSGNLVIAEFSTLGLVDGASLSALEFDSSMTIEIGDVIAILESE